MHGRKTTALLDIQYHKTGMGNIIVKELSVMRADFVQKHINGIDYNMVDLD